MSVWNTTNISVLRNNGLELKKYVRFLQTLYLSLPPIHFSAPYNIFISDTHLLQPLPYTNLFVFGQLDSIYARSVAYPASIDPSHKSHNAFDKYSTMHHFVTAMCTHVVLLRNGALWEMGMVHYGTWDTCIVRFVLEVYYCLWLSLQCLQACCCWPDRGLEGRAPNKWLRWGQDLCSVSDIRQNWPHQTRPGQA